MAATALAGIAFLSINGQSYNVVGELAYQPAKTKKEPLVGQDGYHGFKETPVHAWIKMRLRDRGDLNVEALNNLKDATVTAQLANGKVVIGRNMTADVTEGVDTSEGAFEAMFFGADVSEN